LKAICRLHAVKHIYSASNHVVNHQKCY